MRSGWLSPVDRGYSRTIINVPVRSGAYELDRVARRAAETFTIVELVLREIADTIEEAAA